MPNIEQKENKDELKLVKVTNKKPDKPCHICGCNKWVLRANGVGYVCGICHPKPKGNIK